MIKALRKTFAAVVAKVVLFSVAFTAVMIESDSLQARSQGLQNSGFEFDLTGWNPAHEADKISIVGTESSTLYSSYSENAIDDIVPYKGSKMLRIGSPKIINEKQLRGLNTVSQTFYSDNTRLRISFRLFSWEHRGTDAFQIDLRDANGNSFNLSGPDGSPLKVSFPDGSQQACSSTPCRISIDVGKRGSILDSGWLEVHFAGLPDDGTPLTLEYILLGGDNEAHASWVYVDNVNLPPVAKFEFDLAQPVEGDPVSFTDTSFDPDVGDQIVAWEWRVDGPQMDSSIPVADQNPVFVLADNGNYQVSLTVWDSYGDSDTVTTGMTARDGTFIPAIVAANGAPLVRVLNQEVIKDSTVKLLARLVDPGFLDTHQANWIVDETAIGVVNEENIPAYASGIIEGQIIAKASSGLQQGEITVLDNDGDITSKNFKLQVLDVVDSREPNDTLSQAPVLNSNWIYLSDISSKTDVDIFEIRDEQGNPLQAGSEVLVKLANLKGDFDVVVFTQLPSDVSATPWLRSPWLRSPWLRSPWLRSPWLRSPWLRSPWLRSPWLRSPWLRSPWLRSPWLRSPFANPAMSIEQLPLSEQFGVATEGENIAESDIGLTELGLGFLTTEGITLGGVSANRGLEDEDVLIRTEYPGAKVYVAVVGNNGAYSTAPYSLQIETSKPLDISAFLGDTCKGQPLVDSATANSDIEVLSADSATPKTLFITQRQRLVETYSLDQTGWEGFLADMNALANHGQVAGHIVSMPSTSYDNWDRNPCSVDAANEVADSIAAIAKQYIKAHPGIENVVLLGSDNIVPFKRVPDRTSISNERLYTEDSLVRPGTPLFASIVDGNNLTDDHIVDFNPAIALGGELYVPDLAIGRLVESPTEMVAMAQAFLSSDGMLDLNTAMVSGYDFFKDGAALSAGYLQQNYVTDASMINDSWSADELRCKLLGSYSSSYSECQVSDVANFNAHLTHYGALSAFGFNNDIGSDFVASSEVAGAGLFGSVLQDKVIFTIGCHGGLNVPDGAGLPGTFGGIDPNLDFPQAMARQKAVYVASLGFGLGDSIGVAGTEKLLANFSAGLDPGTTVGQALMQAKQDYIRNLVTVTDYDVKSTIQTAMYGLPMYRIASNAAVVSAQSPAPGGVTVGSFDLTVNDVVQSKNTYVLEEVSTDFGSYIAAGGQVQAIAGRAMQPSVGVDLSAGLSVHGVVVKQASYELFRDGFDPVITRPTIEWEQNPEEIETCLSTYWPTRLATVNTLGASQNESGTLVVTPGQFNCTSGDSAAVSGLQRNFVSMELDVLRSGSTDYIAPVILDLDLLKSEAGGVTLEINAEDNSGFIDRIVIIEFNGLTSNTIDANVSGMVSPYQFNLPTYAPDSQLLIQVIDTAGNVVAESGKGLNIRYIDIDAGPDLLYSLNDPVSFTARINDFASLVGTDGSVNYSWQFGDGGSDTGLLAESGNISPLVSLDSAGNASFNITHTYTKPGDYIARLRVSDSNSGIGSDDVKLRQCSDPVDLSDVDPDIDFVSCAAQLKSTGRTTIRLTTNGQIRDGMQYRIYLDLNTTDSVIDEKADLMLKYHGGTANGLDSLVVTQVAVDTLEFSFDLQEAGWTSGNVFWYAQTQDGVAGGKSIGSADYMPDSGWFGMSGQ